MLLSRIFKTDVTYTKAVCQLLKNTFTALYTGCTITAMCCKQKLYDQFTIFLDTAGVGIDHHSISRLLGTGCKSPASVILNCAETTGSKCGKL